MPGNIAPHAVTGPIRLDDVTENTLLRNTSDGIIGAARTLNKPIRPIDGRSAAVDP
jgi:hypothetical protein